MLNKEDLSSVLAGYDQILYPKQRALRALIKKDVCAYVGIFNNSDSFGGGFEENGAILSVNRMVIDTGRIQCSIRH